ncbi:predicted protein, partial [Naegleria gruberi]
KLAYGTAGFRMKADSILDRVVFTVGLLACLRALDKKESVGVMITASHNGAQDNGVKLVDPTGEMLESTWEEKAVRLANCIHDAKLMSEKFDELVSELKLDLTKPIGKTLCISVAKDTRTSSDRLVSSLKTAVSLFENLGIVHVDYGLMITPQLHYMVMLTNHHEETKSFLNESIYYQDISNAFNLLYRGGEKEITMDCAFGVGGKKIKQLQSSLKDVKFTLVNDYETVGVEESQKYLNHDCGAEHVQKQKAVPINCENFKSVASIDGDGDRLVYFFRDEQNELVLLDGDKIATLLVKFIGELLTKTGLLDQLIVGVVQTAYANGSSTTYLKQILGEQRIFCVPTGVKYLHHKAKELDVGIYFEANGHGTVIFSEKANKAINEMYNRSTTQGGESSEFVQAISDLFALTKLINPTVGDAFSDLLVVEVVLGYYGWSYVDWDKNLYTDVPSVQDKLKVKDRTIIKVSADETQVVSPEGIQNKINECVLKVNKGRAFIRPSGTEDVVRVYAE